MESKRVSIYIVTYRNSVDLNANIASIIASSANVGIYIINNHSQFYLEKSHERAVTVLHNNVRPDFSTGHLSRSWNQALLHGFRSLSNPSNDIVVTVQDDVVFKTDWFDNLIDLHRRYSFITMGAGDAFCSYRPEAVKKVGLWDERFCSLAYQEGDYFLRSLIYNRDGCSINDPAHGRQHNALEGNVYRSEMLSLEEIRSDSLLISTPRRNSERKDAFLSTMPFHPLCAAVFREKWGVSAGPWTADHFAISKSLIQNYITYPYFEKEVELLREKNYVVADEEYQKQWALFTDELSERLSR